MSPKQYLNYLEKNLIFKFSTRPIFVQGTDPNSDHWDGLNGSKSRTSNPAFDWIRGAYGSKGSNEMFRSLEEEVAYLRAQRIGDGTSCGGKDSDSGNNIPYEVLIQDLTQAKRQLLELHSLVSFFWNFYFLKFFLVNVF